MSKPVPEAVSVIAMSYNAVTDRISASEATMKRNIATGWALVLLAGSPGAVGQVYEARDAEGNPVFSDTPSPQGQEIVVPETNVSDPVQETAAPEDMKAADEAAELPQADATGGNDDAGNVVIIGGEDAERKNEYIDNEGRREVRDAEKRHEVLEAEPRHEVR
jgi:hypothetical protein